MKNGSYNGTARSYQEPGWSYFAWTDLGKADLSVQTSIYVSSAITSSDERFGIFVHYPGTGYHKWALVLRDRPSPAGHYLELLDEAISYLSDGGPPYGQASARVSCTITTGVWYTFNMTVRGYQAYGRVSRPGQPTCEVSGTYPASSPAAGGTGFGLYAGGYSTLFDDVVVATVFPYQSNVGFSNSFTNGPSSANIHGSIAGTAELTNSTGTVQAVESYFDYFSWGGLSQARQRYDPVPGTIQWITASNTYDSYGNLRAAIDPKGSSTYYDYSSSYQSAYLTNQTRLDGSTKITTLYNYTFATGNLQWVKDPMGNTTSYQYDILGRVTRIDYGLGAFVQRSYNDTANYVEITNENGWRTRQHYDGFGRLSRVERFGIISAKLKLYNVDASDKGGDFYKTGTSWTQGTVTWNNAPPTEGSALASLGSVSSNTWYEIDVTSLVNREGVFAFRVKSTSSNGADYASKEDTGNMGLNKPKLTITIAGEGSQTQVVTFTPTDDAYIEVGNRANDNFGTATVLKVDNSPVRDLLLRFSVAGAWSYSNETTTYNWQNRVGSSTDPMGNVASYEYDFLARATSTTAPNGKVTSQAYNDLAGWVRMTDQDGNYECGTYDRQGRLLSVVEKASLDCLGIVTNFYYSETGSLTRVTNALSQSTSHSFDNVGRLTAASFPDSTTETYTYDSNTNLVRKIDRKGAKTLYSYDALDRIKTVTYCGSPITSNSYTYDKNSNLLTLQNENATITYNYDARNRGLKEKYEVNLATRQVVDLGCSGSGSTWTVTGGLTKTYTVDKTYNGELLETLTYPALSTTNIAVKYAYDGFGRVYEVTKSGSTSTYYARSFTYYRNDRLKGLQFGNNLIGNYTYDSLSRPSSITLKNGGNTLISLSYTYNNTGTVATVTGQVNGATVNEQYKYDPLQRLTNATVTSQGTTNTLWYEYDGVGNRLRQKLNGAWTTYTYNQSNNRLNSYSAPGLDLAYTYNNDGTLKTRTITTNSTTWAYTWNVPGYLSRVTRNGANQGQYAYDGMGRLVESMESTTSFLAYAGTETLFKNISGSYSTDYLYAGSLRIATVDNTCTLCGFITVRYFHVDHLGSTRLVTLADGSVSFADSYQPFGQDNGNPTGSETLKFTGKPLSNPTGLYYFYQRWYDPAVGRFVSPDPLPGSISKPQSLNSYVYVRNSPLNYADPSGTRACEWWDAVCKTLNLAEQAVSITVDTATTLVREVAEIIEDLAGDVVEAANDAWEKMVQTANDVWEEVVQTANDVWEGLQDVGTQIWNGIETTGQQIQNGFEAINNSLHAAADFVSDHIKITDMNKFLTGVALCAALLVLIVAAWYALPAVAGASLASSAVGGALVLEIGTVGFASNMAFLLGVGVGLGAGCISNLAGSVQIS